ncbi:hypothetical protein FSP39_012925 [Pinctada imbricata]|uniref:t-SNARE coiled-coil homology domain-containing protein n=1 Tax=Pinctada imbricata TaxID=66713 RepID=A0AA88XUA3_PINIB|nr:hypothetical protein FSP39_012925 [Pinctada imbricata]
MATFESSLPQPAPCEVQKYSIRRLEPTIQKFLKIIQIDIDRLRKHRSNFEKFSRLNDWSGFQKENINATRTVQQIKVNIKEIENTRKRIVDEDVEEFDKKTSGMKYDAIHAIQEFLCSNLVELNTMIHEFSSAVQSQQESIDRIEDNIEKAHENVRSGVTNLSKASKYKAAAFPVAGALLGTVIGGPVGFLAGLKIGSVAAIGGGAAGT